MKKTTFILILFVCSIMSAQTTIIDYDTTGGNVSFDFAFGTGFTAAAGANPDMATPTGDGITSPGPNTSANCLITNSDATVAAFGGGYGVQFNVENNLNTNDFITCYVKSTANNFTSRIQFQDSPDNNCVGLTQNPMEADVLYTGAGDWQLVEAQAAYASMDFNCGAQDLGTGDKLFQRITIFTDINDDITTAFTTYIDQIAQDATSSPLLSAEDFKKSEVGIFPNPVTTPALNIKGDITSKTAQIYDLGGRLMATKNITGDFNSVDVSALNTGVYFLKLENGISMKFLKK